MVQSRRQRAWFSVPLLVLAGLASRCHGLPAFVGLYVGDVLWGMLFYALFVCWSPQAPPARAWVLSLATTELIEGSQCYHTPWLERVRDSTLGGLLLGHVFLWSDVYCLAVGTTAAALFDAAEWMAIELAVNIQLRSPRSHRPATMFGRDTPVFPIPNVFGIWGRQAARRPPAGRPSTDELGQE